MRSAETSTMTPTTSPMPPSPIFQIAFMVVDEAVDDLAARFVQRLFLLLANGGQNHGDQDEYARDHESEADRAREEHGRIAARDEQCPPQVLLHQRSQHIAQNEGRRLALELHEDIPEDAGYADQVEVH